MSLKNETSSGEKTRLKSDNPRLFVVSAPSGAGKTTLCKMLLEEFDNITLSISTTTRQRRPKEVEGKDYHFVSMEAFERKIQQQDFAEWAEVHGNRYGTEKKVIEQAIAAGQHTLFDIDYQGALNLKKLYPNRAVLIFVLPPSMKTLEQRLRDRASDTESTIETRLKNAYNELAWSESFHYRIVNDSLEQAYQEIRKVVEKECQ